MRRTFAPAALLVMVACVFLAGQCMPPSGGGGSGAVWGSITGTLSNQSDLNTALGGKAASNAATTVGGVSCALGSTCAPATTVASQSCALGGSCSLASTNLSDSSALVRTSDTGSVTNTMLAHASITVSGTSCTLGSSCSPSGGGSVTLPYLTIGGTAYGPIFAATAPPLTGWTAENSASLTTSGGYLYLSLATSNSVSMRGIYRTAPSAPYTYTFTLGIDASGTTSAGGESGYGIGFRQSSTGKITVYQPQTASSVPKVALNNWNTATSYNGAPQFYSGNSAWADVVRPLQFVKIEDDGTNLKFYKSLDNINFEQVFSVARASFMTGGPDQIFVGGYVQSNAVLVAVYSMH